jgi:hypothetical protein
MSTKNVTAKDLQQTADQKLIDGLEKHQANLSSLLIAGTTIPTTSIITTVQSRIAARTNTAAALTAYHTALAAEEATIAQSKAVVSGTKQAIKVMFAGQLGTLSDFGMTAPKTRAPLTPAEKIASAAKAKATRAARHTMGPKAKAKITGATAAPVAAEAPEAPEAAEVVAPAAPAVAAAPTGAPTTKS